ncbi:MAG: prc [Planctomycetota bacterium]|nr:prc [Planctomycetota bacterium]
MPRFSVRGPRGFLALAAGLIVTAAVVMVRADVQTTKEDRDIVQMVSILLEKTHLAKPTINDEISKRWVKNTIKAFDPRKHYFLKADVDEFHTYDTKLDETIATGDLTFARLVMDRFQKRAEERFADTVEILKQKPDFTIDEAIDTDSDKLEYPATVEEARERVRKQIKFELLRKKLAKMSEEEALKQVSIETRDLHRAYRQYDNVDLLEKYLTGLTMAIDPHSSYMGAKEFEDMFNQRLHKSLIGIGAQLAPEDGYPTVQEIVPGAAADKDGRLQPDDKIIAVVLDDGTRESFVEKKLSDVVRKIRGAAGTKVKLVVIPADSKEEKIYELTRQKVELNADKAKGKIVEFKAADTGKTRKFGIINVPDFYGDSQALNQGDPDAVSVTRDCRKILEGFKKDGVEAVIMDVRFNPGGLLDEAISLSGLFIDKGPIVQIREGLGVKHRDDEDEGTAWDGPLAVVIDHYCASASEIFAGAIKDYGRGLVVGDSSSFGKGSVQNVVSLNERFRVKTPPNLGALKLTIQQFYLPDGESTQIKGVTPHLHIPSVNDFVDYGESRYDTALKFDKVAALPHDKYNRLPNDLLERIREKSEVRRKASPKFQEEEKFIAKAADRKKKHEITLNEKKFREETRADDKADDAKPKAKKGKKAAKKPDSIWEPEYYNDEILAILNDYVTLGSRILVAEPVKATVNADERPPVRP